MDVRKYDIYFKCWPGYLTSEQSERVRYPVQRDIYCSVYYIYLKTSPIALQK